MAKIDDDNLVFSVPTEKDCLCATCVHRLSGVYGYRNAYCEKFRSGSGKPNSILFSKGFCEFYKHD